MKTLFLRDGQYWLHSSSNALLKEQMILILKGKKKNLNNCKNNILIVFHCKKRQQLRNEDACLFASLKDVFWKQKACPW